MNQIIYVGKHPTTYSVSGHMHSSWEFIYCTGGSGFLIFENAKLPYQESDVIMVPPNTPHSNDGRDGFTNIHLNMLDPAVSADKPSLIHDDENSLLLHAFEGAFYSFHSKKYSPGPLLEAYGSLIARLINSLFDAPAYSSVVEQIQKTILGNYTNPGFQLDDFLRNQPYSYDYIRKLFKKEVRQTPHQYLTSVRLQAALNYLGLMDKNELNISEIAQLCGFSNPLYFSRIFKKKYHVSPTKASSLLNKPGSLTSDDLKIMI